MYEVRQHAHAQMSAHATRYVLHVHYSVLDVHYNVMGEKRELSQPKLAAAST